MFFPPPTSGWLQHSGYYAKSPLVATLVTDLCIRVESRVLDLSGSWTHVDAATLLYALSELGHRVREESFLPKLAALLQAPEAERMGPQDRSSILSGLLLLGYKPEEEEARGWGRQIAHQLLSYDFHMLLRLGRGVEALEGAEWGAFRALVGGVSAGLKQRWERVGMVSGARAAATLQALGRAGLYPGAEGADYLLGQVLRDLSEGQVEPADVRRVLVALAALRHVPGAEAAEALLRSATQHPWQDLAEAVGTLWSLLQLGVVPEEAEQERLLDSLPPPAAGAGRLLQARYAAQMVHVAAFWALRAHDRVGAVPQALAGKCEVLLRAAMDAAAGALQDWEGQPEERRQGESAAARLHSLDELLGQASGDG